MKNLNSLLALIALTASVVQAQLPDALPQITSRASFRTYVLEQADHAYVWLWDQSAVTNPSPRDPVYWTMPSSASDITKAIDSFVGSQSVTAVNPLDWVSLNVGVYNADNDLLFSGVSSVQPQYDKGGYSLPTFGYAFAINWEAPLRIPGIKKAEIIVTVNNGESGPTEEKIKLRVENGKVYFQSEYAGGGYLELTSYNDQVASYDLTTTNGAMKSLTFLGLAGKSRSSFQGIYPFNNPNYICWKVFSKDGIGENPVFEVTATDKNILSIDVNTTEGARAIGYSVRMRGSTTETPYYLRPGTTIVEIPIFSLGVMYITPIWKKDEFREQDPPKPWWYYGKG